MKNKIFFLLILLVLIVPLRIFAYTEPALFIAGERYTESASGEKWSFDADTKTLTLNGWKYTGDLSLQNGHYSFIESDFDELTIVANGTSTFNLTGVDITKDIYGIKSDTETSIVGDTAYNNNAHIIFTGTGQINIILSNGHNMYGVFGNDITISGPRISVNATGTADNIETTDVNEASELLTGIKANTLEMTNGKYGVSTYGYDKITSSYGINVNTVHTTGGEISVTLMNTLSGNSSIACRGDIGSFTNTKVTCVSSNTTTIGDNGTTLLGHNIGIHFEESLSFKNSTVVANSGQIVSDNTPEYVYAYGIYSPLLTMDGGTFTITAKKSYKQNAAINADALLIKGSAVVNANTLGTESGINNGYAIMSNNLHIADNAQITTISDASYNITPVYDGGYYPEIYAGMATPGELVETITSNVYQNKFVKIVRGTAPVIPDPEPETYTLSFNANGGSGSMESITELTGTYTLPENGFTAPDNKQFKGWSLTTDGELITTVEMTENRTVYAIWEDINNTNPDEPNPDTPVAIVTPNKPVAKIAKGNNNALVVSWDHQDVSTHYLVYRSKSKTKGYKLVKTISADEFIQGGLGYGKTYYFKVKACNDTKCSGYSNIVYKKVVPNKVENLRASSVGTNSIKLAWDKVNVTGYQIQRSTNGKKWSTIKTITKNGTLSYSNTRLSANKKYYYRVRAYKYSSGRRVYGSWSTVLVMKTSPSKPKISVSLLEYNELRINISGVSGATKYILQRSTDKKTYELVSEFNTAVKYYDVPLETGLTYYYRVRACNSDNHCSGWVTTSKKLVPLTPSFSLKSSTTKNITITVNRLDNATGYEIYRATSRYGKYTKVKELLSEEEILSYVNSTTKGKRYYYKVRSYMTINDKKIYSSFSSVKNIVSK